MSTWNSKCNFQSTILKWMIFWSNDRCNKSCDLPWEILSQTFNMNEWVTVHQRLLNQSLSSICRPRVGSTSCKHKLQSPIVKIKRSKIRDGILSLCRSTFKRLYCTSVIASMLHQPKRHCMIKLSNTPGKWGAREWESRTAGLECYHEIAKRFEINYKWNREAIWNKMKVHRQR